MEPGTRKLLLDYLTALDSLDMLTRQLREQEEIVRSVREGLWTRLSERGLMDTSIWVAEWLVWADEHGDVHRRRVLRIP